MFLKVSNVPVPFFSSHSDLKKKIKKWNIIIDKISLAARFRLGRKYKW